LAKIEHFPEQDTDGNKQFNNIVYSFDTAQETPREWFNVACKCDACKTRRARNYTFIVEHKDGTRAQVGRECLKMYTGIDGGTAAYFAQVIEDIDEQYNVDDGADVVFKIKARVFTVEDVIACAAAEIAKNGYIKAEHGASSTRAAIAENIMHFEPTAEQEQNARSVVDWCIAGMGTDNYLSNAGALCKAGYCKPSHFGILAYLPRAFEIAQERARREQERAAKLNNTAHVGNIGDKITINIDSVMRVTSYTTQVSYYNAVTTYVYKIMSGGNAFIWRTQKTDIETAAQITGTIKAHEIFNGERQTVLTRCKVSGTRADIKAAQERNAQAMADINAALDMLTAGA
jgi:hypothetical protein